ncbi:MAG: hypothetical protein NT149_03670 [Candidatus Gottesmanbacteria bacterium]|nr:hypothetical protein [Candidatus Gottesmanbacteria bacterium]
MQNTEKEILITNQKSNTTSENSPTNQQDMPTSDKVLPPQKSKYSKILLYGGILLIVFVVSGAGLYFYEVKTLQQNKSTKIQTNTTTNPTTAQVNQQQYKEKNWSLRRVTKIATDTILTLPDRENQIVHWGDYLFYGSGDYSSNVQVYSYNFKIGEKKTIYNQESRNDLGSGRNNRYVSDMQVLNNTLFFSIGGYMTSGATFWMTLPPAGQPQILTGGANGKIQYWKDRYWLINGEGDACWGGTSYSLIDLATKKVTEIASSNSGCMEGEEYVDIDKRNRMILAFHTAGTGEGEAGSGIYQYVIAVPLSNPTMKEGVIAKQDMPAGITSVTYLADTDQLLLTGKEKYLFDFSSKMITKTEISPVVPTPSPEPQNKTFKDKVQELNLPSGYEFVLE